MAVTHRSRSDAVRASAATFNRFLKPGALARLRDSRISSTSKAYNKSDANLQISVASTGSGIEQLQQIDESFVFTMRTFGPRFLQRKKLGARKSAFVAPASTGDVGIESGMETQTPAADVAAH